MLYKYRNKQKLHLKLIMYFNLYSYIEQDEIKTKTFHYRLYSIIIITKQKEKIFHWLYSISEKACFQSLKLLFH